MADFTPGPWRIVSRKNAQLPNEWLGIRSGTLMFAAADLERDARLIAAAPELYEALEEAHLFLCYITEENTDARNDEDLLVWHGDRLRTALAKARGES